MKTPTFNILLSPNSVDSRVICNGTDISRAICGIKVTQDPFSALHLELTIAPGEALVTLGGEIQILILELKTLSKAKLT